MYIFIIELHFKYSVYNVNTRITVIVTAVAHLLWCNISAQCAAMSLTV